MDYDQVKNTIWVIRVTDHACKSSSHSYLGGVSISKNRILTCAHGITDTSTVSGRRFYQKGFDHQLETTHVRENLDLRMLKCKNEPVDDDFEYARISDDEIVGVLEKIYYIGSPKGLTGSYFIGRAGIPCIKVDPSTFSDSRVCGEHVIDHGGCSQYLTMDSVSRGRVGGMEFIKKIHPMVPVIGCGGIHEEISCSGGPLFKKNGDLLGIVTHQKEFVFAVHVSAIKAFIAEAKSIDERIDFGNNKIQNTEKEPEQKKKEIGSLSLSPSVKMNFDEVGKNIWVIRVMDPDGYACWGPNLTYIAGVSVDKNRILTSDNDAFITDTCTVWGRRFHEVHDTGLHELETVHVRQNWGLRLLKCKKDPVLGVELEYGKLSDDEILNYRDKVYHCGHPRGLVGSWYFGYASYSCAEVNQMSFSDSRVSKDLRISKDDMFEKVPPPYRTTGDFLNVDTFLEGDTPDAEIYRKFHPMLPFVQCSNIPVETGNFGGPLFRENGDIMGIVTHNYGGFCMAVHVSALKAFLDEAKSKNEKVGAKDSKKARLA